MKNAMIEGILYFSTEIKGKGIVSARYKEINELFTEKRVLNFFTII